MAGVIDHKCKNCTAVLKFNPHDQNWKCEYCKSVFTKEELDEYEKQIGKEELTKESTEVKLEKNEQGMDIYSCPNCGAEIIADENTSATFCVYCKNTAILRNKLVGEFNPTQIIPFYKTKEDAIAAFTMFRKGKPLAPKEFSNEKNISEIRGIYIPFWLFDYDVLGVMDATGTKVTSWRSGDYRYTKTDTYSVYRSGTMEFKKIPVDGSVRFQNDIMNSIEPFDYRKLVDFDYSYLSGFLAEKYDVDSSSASKDSWGRAKTTTTNVLRSNISGYTTVTVTNTNIQANNFKSDYVLLPVWLLNIKYKDKIYTFAMNGQTGKMIGDIPVDKKKAVIIALLVFVGTFILVSLIWLVGGIV